jgi:hypothetical protein
MRRIGFILISASLLPSFAAEAADRFAGTWRLNTHKSKYADGVCPKSMIIEIEAVGSGVKYHSETTQHNGTRVRAEYTADYDGTEAIVMATTGLMMPVSLQRTSERTVVALYKRGMQVIATSHLAVSKNGRVLTIVTVSPNRNGKSVTNVCVYERVCHPESSPTGKCSSSTSPGKTPDGNTTALRGLGPAAGIGVGELR